MGKLKFGPDIEYPLPGTETLDYSLPTGAREQEIIDKFHTAVTKYLRNVDKSRLYVDYAGIRPKLSGLNDPFQDFVIEKETDGFINLLGIESPGLTSSLAIAEYVVDELLEGGALSQ